MGLNPKVTTLKGTKFIRLKISFKNNLISFSKMIYGTILIQAFLYVSILHLVWQQGFQLEPQLFLTWRHAAA